MTFVFLVAKESFLTLETNAFLFWTRSLDYSYNTRILRCRNNVKEKKIENWKDNQEFPP